MTSTSALYTGLCEAGHFKRKPAKTHKPTELSYFDKYYMTSIKLLDCLNFINLGFIISISAIILDQ